MKDTIINKYLEVEKMSNEEAIRLYKTGKNNVLKVMKVMLVENLMEETEARPVLRSKRRVIRPSWIHASPQPGADNQGRQLSTKRKETLATAESPDGGGRHSTAVNRQSAHPQCQQYRVPLTAVPGIAR